ncbi:uncharacterized protein N7459_007027 [Penicillium hispanicum]|uniref:uncharacterized protein n=1 Tax=Penicillium hispanicum TaxID=1080232 RepID=UPI0025425CD4|nr:uncharacterized protein N7459_007027 [Penicillium hispanicum]KAJ5578063.1 hypothetical protein N7459_007027 [Penicillium hispanicum]
MRRIYKPNQALAALLALHGLAASATADSAVCYYPSGHSEQSLVYEPCPASNGGTRMCCGTNRTNPFDGSASNGRTADMCLENGLCMNAHKDSQGTTLIDYWRDSCTSNDWATGGCLDVCTNGTEGSYTGTAQITPCDGTENSEYWCCGLKNTTCCGTSDAISIAANFAQTTSFSSSTSTRTSATTSSSSSETSTSTGSPSPSLTITNTPIPLTSAASLNSTSSPALSTGAKVGIGVGVGVGAASMIALILFYTLWQRKKDPALTGRRGNPRDIGVRRPRELDSYAASDKTDAFTDPPFSTEFKSLEIRHELHADSMPGRGSS